MLRGSLSEEREVKAPANQTWNLYGTLRLAHLAVRALPNLFTKIDVVQGDGSVGTVLHLFFAPEVGMASYKEKFMVIDNERLVKETEVVEGGYLDLGFTLYRVRFEVIEKEGMKDECCCIVRATIEYELKEEAAANAALVSLEAILTIMQAAADDLYQNHSSAQVNTP